MGRVEGKIALITGAAKGLGEADARLLAKEGATVILTDVDEENGRRVAAEIGSRARFFRHDVRKEEEWRQIVAQLVTDFGGLDILINNAGVVEVGSIENASYEGYRLTMDISVDGSFLGCKHALPAMRGRPSGSIVNMGSIAAILGSWQIPAYCAAKGAVDALTRSIAAHCTHHQLKVRCNSVHPGGMDTTMVSEMPAKLRAAFPPSPDVTEATDRFSREKRPYVLGKPVDIANAVLYLASDESRFVNGQRIVVDNGVSTRQQ